MYTNNFKVKFFITAPMRLENRRKLKIFINRFLLENANYLSGEINYIFCNDKDLLQINQDFLHHDFYTDIVTFDLSAPESNMLHSEIYISVDRVKDNARVNLRPFKEELHRVIFHGILHLCGYKDKTKREEALMRSMEDKCLNEYFNFVSQ